MNGNYAYIDAQNVNLAIQECGWRLDWRKFYHYLKEKYKAKKIYFFVGYIRKNENLYKKIKSIGYTLVFKEVSTVSSEIKGNVDAELVLQCAVDIANYDNAIIVSNDGDFSCLVKYLYGKNKLKCVLSPNIYKCSSLLKKSSKGKMRCLNVLKDKLKMKPHYLKTKQ